MLKSRHFCVLWLACTIFVPSSTAGQVVVGAESIVAPDPRQENSRYIGFRPHDGAEVALNPPRISWSYLPDVVPRGVVSLRHFTLQISSSPDFVDPEVEIESTPYNFYSYLPPLTGASEWFWRVRWIEDDLWSDTRSFTISPTAVTWDRSQIPALLEQPRAHPRMLFTADTRDEIFDLYRSEPLSWEAGEYLRSRADEIILQTSYIDFPTDDSVNMNYRDVGRDLVEVMFAWLMTGDERYTGFKERFLTVASWPPGGFSSPENSCHGCTKWGIHLNTFLGLFYDWMWDELTPTERTAVLDSLDWRFDLTINNFAWRVGAQDGVELTVPTNSVAMANGSHTYVGALASLTGALAVYDELPIAREVVDLGLHYLIAITNGFGEDEAWNEGPAYGSSKFGLLVNTSLYVDTLLPEIELAKNPAYDAYIEFLARTSPLGAERSSFGNNSGSIVHRLNSRIANFRKASLFTQSGIARSHWSGAQDRWEELHGTRLVSNTSRWVDFVAPFYYDSPSAETEVELSRLFALEGWVTSTTAPPSDVASQEEAVSVTFQARPRGGYSHSFRSDIGFDIHAYGETIASGGGTTRNNNPFGNHSMSHNTILVDGHEQVRSLSEFDVETPVRTRVIAFAEGEDFVYWAGDATPAYAVEHGLERVIRHMLFVNGQYIFIYDDLRIDEGADPAHFYWLYHTMPDVPLAIDAEAGTFRYAIGDTQVLGRHFRNVGLLDWRNLVNKQGMANPVTGEDLSNFEGEPSNNLWVRNRNPSDKTGFVVLVAPYLPTDVEPVIEHNFGTTEPISVTFRGETRTISFDTAHPGDITIDIETIGELGAIGAQ